MEQILALLHFLVCLHLAIYFSMTGLFLEKYLIMVWNHPVIRPIVGNYRKPIPFRCTVVLLSHCLVVSVPSCPIVPLSRSFSILLFSCPIVLFSCCPIFLSSCCPVSLLSCFSVVPLSRCPVVPLSCCLVSWLSYFPLSKCSVVSISIQNNKKGTFKNWTPFIHDQWKTQFLQAMQGDVIKRLAWDAVKRKSKMQELLPKCGEMRGKSRMRCFPMPTMQWFTWPSTCALCAFSNQESRAALVNPTGQKASKYETIKMSFS